MNNFDKVVSQRIREYLESHGIKQTHLVKQTGIKMGVLNNIVNGRSKVSMEYLKNISSALGLPLSYFLDNNSIDTQK